MMEWTQDLPFSRSYLMIVMAVAAVVTGLAIYGQNSTLALAAAILGLYVLHLYSNYQLAANQRRQWHTLREVERMLGVLDDAQADAGQGTSPEDSGAPAGSAADGRSGGKATRGEESAESAAPGADAGAAGGAPTPGERTRGAETGEPKGDEDDDTVLVPRQYRLGTVAVVQRVLTPGKVARVLAVQDRKPDRQFGDIAVELDFLSESELEELLELQRRGLYRPEAISRARDDLKEFQRRKATELGTGP